MSTAAHLTLRVAPESLATELGRVTPDTAFGVIVTDVSSDRYGDLGAIAWTHRSLLSRWCVGVVAVSDDPDARARITDAAGLVPFPLTAVADPRDAEGWIAGQHAAGVRGVRPANGGRSVAATPWLDDYLLELVNPPADPIAAALAASTRERFGEDAGMNIGEDQGRFLQLLVELTGAVEVVEVGTFTGMSALWIARALPETGRLTCFEIDPECIELGRVAWEAAGVDDRITVVIGPAAEGLAALPHEPCVDLAFVDADKTGYATYVDELLPRLRPGGLIAIDNTLWGGAVVHPGADDESTLALRSLNRDLASRADLAVFTVPIADGITFVRRNGDRSRVIRR
jgi:caffeoyl-CoA O-methyltransferase